MERNVDLLSCRADKLIDKGRNLRHGMPTSQDTLYRQRARAVISSLVYLNGVATFDHDWSCTRAHKGPLPSILASDHYTVSSGNVPEIEPFRPCDLIGLPALSPVPLGFGHLQAGHVCFPNAVPLRNLSRSIGLLDGELHNDDDRCCRAVC